MTKKKEEKTVKPVVRPAVKTDVTIKDGIAVLDGYFRMSEGTFKVLERNIQKNVSVCLVGPTGVGKSELAYNMAACLGLPCTIFDMGTMTDPIMGLVGTHAIKIREGKTESQFIPSRFSQVIQHPGVVVLDELSRSNAQSLNLLFPVLDFRRELSMEYSFDDVSPVKVHPECVFIATANIGSQYTGTHKMDRALVDRFMMVEVDAMDDSEIKKILKHHYGKLITGQINKIVKCYTEINKGYEDCKSNFNLSLRHLKQIAHMVQDGFTIYDSFYALCKGIGSKEGLKAVEQILKDVKEREDERT